MIDVPILPQQLFRPHIEAGVSPPRFFLAWTIRDRIFFRHAVSTSAVARSACVSTPAPEAKIFVSPLHAALSAAVLGHPNHMRFPSLSDCVLPVRGLMSNRRKQFLFPNVFPFLCGVLHWLPRFFLRMRLFLTMMRSTLRESFAFGVFSPFSLRLGRRRGVRLNPWSVDFYIFE